MGKTVSCIEIRSPDGALLFSVHFVEKELGTERRAEPSGYQKTQYQKERGNSSNGDPMITEAQKRYLFRILADQGIERERAYQYLKENFGVGILKDVSKADASRMIKQLLGENGGGSDGPPF